MTIPSATITLTYDPTGTPVAITLASPPPGYSALEERAQSLGKTADGTTYVYDRETLTYTLTLPLVLTLSQMNALKAWHASTVKGSLNTFRLVDHLGNTLNACRFAEPTLQYAKTKGARYSVTLKIITPSLPV